MQGLYEENSDEIVAARIASGANAELGAVLASIVRHVHQAVRETRPTAAQWRATLEFLTEIGQASDERRQEWVLLSDLLGVTQLVEEINSNGHVGTTPVTSRGPFYREDGPRLPLGADINLDGKGERLTVTGHVRSVDGAPVPGAIVETWQANDQGWYENQQPDLQPEFNLRGVFRADEKGDFHYLTVRPGGYNVPDDGPAGRLLGAIAYPFRRPAHLHFILRAPGFEALTTHVYDSSDPHLNDDALFGVKSELVAEFVRSVGNGNGPEWALDFTFVMAPTDMAKP